MAGPFRTKQEYVEQAIREAILRGELRPGMWVRSEEWAARLGTSLTPVREAVQKLGADGLLRLLPHRGAQVAGISRAEFEEVYQLRAAIEGLAAYRAGLRLDEESAAALAARLEAVQEQMAATVSAKEMPRTRELSREFHLLIYRQSESPHILRLIDNLWVRFPWEPLALVPGRTDEAIREHRAIIEAVRRRDAEEMRTAMSAHISSGARATIEAPDLGFFSEE